jgi:hypothetical protein
MLPALPCTKKAAADLVQLQSQLDNGQLIPNITDLASSATLTTNSTLLRAFVQVIDSTLMEDDSTPTLLWARASESLKTALQSRAEADVALAAARAISIQQQLTTRYNSVRSEMTAFADALLDAKHVTAEGRALQDVITGQLARLDKHTAADILFYNSAEHNVAALPSDFAIQIKTLAAQYETAASYEVGLTSNGSIHRSHFHASCVTCKLLLGAHTQHQVAVL